MLFSIIYIFYFTLTYFLMFLNGPAAMVDDSSNNTCFWSGHEISLLKEKRDEGNSNDDDDDGGQNTLQFYISVYSDFVRPPNFMRRRDHDNNNTEEGLPVYFHQDLLNANPVKLQFSGGGKDWDQVDAAQWREACESVGACKALKSIKFYVPFCHGKSSGKTVRYLLQSANESLEELEINDGLEGYSETFPAMERLRLLHTLTLKDMSHRQPINSVVCRNLAAAIRSLPSLRKLVLWNVCFTRFGDWLLIFDAIKEKTELEEVDFKNLNAFSGFFDSKRKNVDPSMIDFSQQVGDLRHLEENKAALAYLGHHSTKPYSMSDRVTALLHVRLQASDENKDGVNDTSRSSDRNGAGSSTSTTSATATAERADSKKHQRFQARNPEWLRAVAALSDRLNYSYHLLRYESDPGAWSEIDQVG